MAVPHAALDVAGWPQRRRAKGIGRAGRRKNLSCGRCAKLRERYEGKAITTRELLDVFAEDLPPSLRYEGKASLDWFLDGWVNGTSSAQAGVAGCQIHGEANATVATGVIRQKDAPEDLVTSVPIYAVVSGKAPVLCGTRVCRRRRVFVSLICAAGNPQALAGSKRNHSHQSKIMTYRRFAREKRDQSFLDDLPDRNPFALGLPGTGAEVAPEPGLTRCV